MEVKLNLPDEYCKAIADEYCITHGTCAVNECVWKIAEGNHIELEGKTLVCLNKDGQPFFSHTINGNFLPQAKKYIVLPGIDKKM